MTDKPKRKGGFASMSPERLREVSAKGGAATAPENRSFSKDPGLAREAARLGGRLRGAASKAKSGGG